jgi:hypothetical protein
VENLFFSHLVKTIHHQQFPRLKDLVESSLQFAISYFCAGNSEDISYTFFEAVFKDSCLSTTLLLFKLFFSSFMNILF